MLEQAITTLELARRLAPENRELLKKLATAYLEVDEVDHAVEVYAKLHALQGNRSRYPEKVGELALKLKRPALLTTFELLNSFYRVTPDQRRSRFKVYAGRGACDGEFVKPAKSVHLSLVSDNPVRLSD